MTDQHSRASLMGNLGAFFGHIIKGIRTDPAARPATPVSPDTPQRTVVAHHVDERTIPAPDSSGDRLILRRTTIDEVERAPAEP